jgi:hypothetical protein
MHTATFTAICDDNAQKAFKTDLVAWDCLYQWYQCTCREHASEYDELYGKHEFDTDLSVLTIIKECFADIKYQKVFARMFENYFMERTMLSEEVQNDFYKNEKNLILGWDDLVEWYQNANLTKGKQKLYSSQRGFFFVTASDNGYEKNKQNYDKKYGADAFLTDSGLIDFMVNKCQIKKADLDFRLRYWHRFLSFRVLKFDTSVEDLAFKSNAAEDSKYSDIIPQPF